MKAVTTTITTAKHTEISYKFLIKRLKINLRKIKVRTTTV